MLPLKINKAHPGFTLIEILISVAIIVIISAVLAMVFIDVFSANSFLGDSFFIEREASATLRDMVQEIRTSSNSSTGGYFIEKADPFSIAFYTNVDKDATKERVQYFLSGTTLKKSVVEPAGSPVTYATTTASESVKTVLSYVVASSTAPIFLYFDKNYGGTSTPMTTPVNILNIRLVRIAITVDQNAFDDLPPMSVGSEVGIRNLKYVQ